MASTPISLNPSTTALIVVDMQNDFAHPQGSYTRFRLAIPDFDPSSGPKAVGPIQRLLRAARRSGMFVVHTQIVRKPSLGTPPPRKILPKSFSPAPNQPPRLVEGTWGAETMEDLKPAEGEYVLRKLGYSAFYGTDLERVLRRRGVDTVIITGTVTYACVLHTAFDAYVRDFDVAVATDGVASWVPALQEPAVRIMELLLGAALPADQIAASIQGVRS
ncbi:MAG: cysteine hydrolase [Chloroflexi bacterium]|nr:cysteine hydrolase [Chloroflexota bacterium]